MYQGGVVPTVGPGEADVEERKLLELGQVRLKLSKSRHSRPGDVQLDERGRQELLDI